MSAFNDQYGTPPHYVVASHEEDGLIFEVIVFKDDAGPVQNGIAEAFYAQPRVRIRRAGGLVADYEEVGGYDVNRVAPSGPPPKPLRVPNEAER